MTQQQLKQVFLFERSPWRERWFLLLLGGVFVGLAIPLLALANMLMQMGPERHAKAAARAARRALNT